MKKKLDYFLCYDKTRNNDNKNLLNIKKERQKERQNKINSYTAKRLNISFCFSEIC